MKNISSLLLFIIAFFPLVALAQPNYVIDDVSTCSDTFTVTVSLEHTGTITATEFGVFWNGAEVELLDSTLLLGPNFVLTNRIDDTIKFTLSYSPTMVSGKTGVVDLRFRRITTLITSTDLDFITDFPRPIIADENFVREDATTQGGTVSFTNFEYNDCPSDIMMSNDLGLCGASVSWTPPTLVDCDGTGMETLPTQGPGSFFNIGTTTITYTATNAAGETAICTFDITVSDDEDPEITCPTSLTVNGDLFGNAVVNGIAPTDSDDNCPNPSITYSIEDNGGTVVSTGNTDASGETFPEGMNTITYVITDASGNKDSCEFNITVLPANVDALIKYVPRDPIDCGDDSIVVDVLIDQDVVLTSLQFSPNWDQAIIALNNVNPSGSPNPTGANYSGVGAGGMGATVPGQMGYFWFSLTPRLFSDEELLFTMTFDVVDNSGSTTITCGTNPNISQASDANGNSVDVNCQDLMVDFTDDDTPPTVTTCPTDITVYANDDCEATATWNDPVFEDNCDGMGLSGMLVSGSGPGSVFDEGNTVIRYEYTDDAGNGPAVCSFMVTVLDTIKPELVCQDATVYLDASGNYTILESDVVASKSDNCAGTINVAIDPATVGCADIPNTTVTVTGTDSNNNSISCNSTITVIDTIDPTAICMNAIIQLDANGNATLNANAVNNGSTDNCSIMSITVSPSSFNCGDIGDQIVTLTVTDQSNNTSTCQATVTIEDNILPTITCPANQSVTTPNTTAVVNGIAPLSVSDNCGIPTVTYNLTGVTSGMGNVDASGETFNLGVTTVRYYVEDSEGNRDSCDFTVTVTQNVDDPFIDCPDITRSYSTAPDRCDTAIFNIDPFLYLPPPIMADSVTWRAFGSTSGSGNDDVSGFNFNTGTTTVRYIAYFDNGDIDSCDFTINVDDNQAPVLVSNPPDVTIYVTQDTCGVDYDWDDPVVDDNCPDLDFEILGRSNLSEGHFFPGVDTVKYEITDQGGNILLTRFTVTTLDTLNPIIVCPMDTTILVDVGITDTIVNSLTWLSDSDNCMVDNIYYKLSGATNRLSVIGDSIDASGERFNAGTTLVTYYITDVNGNMDSCSFNVRVSSFMFPDFDCPTSTTLYADADCEAKDQDLIPMTDPTMFDTIYHRLDLATMASDSGFILDQDFNLGLTRATYFYGLNGELDSCSFFVNVVDTLLPTIICSVVGDTTISVLPGITDTLVNDIAAAAMDNCNTIDMYYTLSGATTGTSDTSSLEDASGERFNLGNTLVTYHVIDTAGNRDSCSFNVIINELQLQFDCPSDTTLFADAMCMATSIVDSPVADSVLFDSIYYRLDMATIGSGSGYIGEQTYNVGQTRATYFYEVGSNLDSCSFLITVNDTLAPSVQCEVVGDTTIIVGLSITDTLIFDIGANFTDNCGIAGSYYTLTGATSATSDTIVAHDASGERFNIDTTLVSYYAYDAAGNIDSCSFNVIIVQDDPELICPADTTLYTGSDDCIGTSSLLAPTITGSTPINSLITILSGAATDTLNVTANDYEFPLGTTNVNYRAVLGMDTIECDFDVTVLDTFPPDIICQADTLLMIEGIEDDNIYLGYMPTIIENCDIDTAYYQLMRGDSMFVENEWAMGDTILFSRGVNHLEIFAQDASGLIDSCEQEISILAYECPLSRVFNNEMGECYGITNNIDFTFDPDSLVSEVYYTFESADTTIMVNEMGIEDSASGDTLGIGFYTLTYFIVNTNNDTTSCSSFVRILDNEAPFFLECPTDTIRVGSNLDDCRYIFNRGAILALDNCALDTVITNVQIGDTLNSGFTDIRYIAFDESGNSDTCEYVLEVFTRDFELECPDSIVISVVGDVLVDNSGLIDSVMSFGCDSIQLFFGAPSGFIDCQDTLASVDAQSLFDSGDIFDLGRSTVIYSLDREGEVISCPVDFIVVKPDGPMIAEDTVTICQGSFGLLSAIAPDTSAYGYTWSYGDSILSNNDTLLLNTFVESGYYTLSSLSQEGCEYIDSAFVIINDLPDISIATNYNGCLSLGDSVALCAVNLDSTQIVSWVWNTPDSIGVLDSCIIIPAVDSSHLGMYFLTATNQNGCSARAQLQIDTAAMLELPILAASDTTICAGEAINIGVQDYMLDGLEYVWMVDDSIGTGLPIFTDTFEFNQIIPSGDSVVYSVFVRNGDCTSDTVSLIVYIDSVPLIGVGSNSPIYCATENDTLFLNSEQFDNSVITSYTWRGPNNFTSSSADTLIFPVADTLSGQYILTSISENGCSDMDTVNVVISETFPAPQILGGGEICFGDSITLSSSLVLGDAYNYVWSSDNTAIDGIPTLSDTSSITVTPLQDTSIVYSLVIQVEGCISDTARTTVIVNSPPVSSLTYNGPFFCLTSDTTLILQDTLTNGVSYTWTAPDGTMFDSSYVEIDSVNLADAGTYTVEIIDSNGCISYDSIMVAISDMAPVPIIDGNSMFCNGDSIIFSVLMPVDSATYVWTGPNGYTDMGSMVIIGDAGTSNIGDYQVSISIAGCGDTISAPFAITDVISALNIRDTSITVPFESSDVTTINIDNFNPNVTYSDSIVSGPSNGTISITIGLNGPELTYTPDIGFFGNDIVTYLICPDACPDECTMATITYTVEFDAECVVSNVITPDNDGVNDELIIRCLQSNNFPENEFVIFNQWGDEIYRAAPYLNDWGGTYEGEPVPDGTYFYIFRESPTSSLKKGFITVIR